MSKEKKNILKIKMMLKKNKPYIARILLSQEFIMQLSDYPKIVEIENKTINKSTPYVFNEESKTTEDQYEVTCLFGVECAISPSILKGAVVEMKNGEFFILKNI